MPTALDYLPPPPAKRPELDAKQAPSPKRYKSVRILFALRDKSAHNPFAPDAVSDATDHPRCRASRRQFIPSCTPWPRGWRSPANVERRVNPGIAEVWTLRGCRSCSGGQVWPNGAQKDTVKCVYPTKKALTIYSTKPIIGASNDKPQPSLFHHIRRMYQVHTVTSLTAI